MRRGNGREKLEEAHIRDVVRYFSLFQYAPTGAQIRQFMPIKVPSSQCKALLEEMVTAHKLEKGVFGMPPVSIYTMGGHSILLKKRTVRKGYTNKKIERLKIYSRILYFSPWIRMVGISGTCSMDNAKASDDVDFFIITAKNRLWLARLWAIAAAKLLRVHRSRRDVHVSGKACLNMFFDEQNITIPKHKQSLYTAHEVAQMRLIDMRAGAYYYRLFIQSNRWIRTYFPNIRIVKLSKDEVVYRHDHRLNLGILGGLMEKIAKTIQYSKMLPHITNEIITDTQLWFFPKDFGKKITRHLGAASSLSR